MTVLGIKFVRVARNEWESKNGLTLLRDEFPGSSPVWLVGGDSDDVSSSGDSPAEALAEFWEMNGK